MIKTFASWQGITGVLGIRSPRGRSRFARVALVLAWVVFWVNTALFPCCESLAAAFDDHSDSVLQSTSAAQPAHQSDDTHSEHSEQSPSSHCDYALDAGPAISGAYAALPMDRVDIDWFAITTLVAPDLTTAKHSANLAPRDYHPPPPFRRYLHTQRLLI